MSQETNTNTNTTNHEQTDDQNQDQDLPPEEAERQERNQKFSDAIQYQILGGTLAVLIFVAGQIAADSLMATPVTRAFTLVAMFFSLALLAYGAFLHFQAR